MRRTTTGRRARSCALALAVFGLAVLVTPSTAGAATSGIGPDVAERRAAWEDAERAVELATAHRAELLAALAGAEDAENLAARTVDVEAALLTERERELEHADEALRRADAEEAAASATLRRAVARYERALEAALARRAELGVAAASAYTKGDPGVKALDGLARALDQSATMSEFLAATERLTYVATHARGELDRANDAVGVRGGHALEAAGVLAVRQVARAAARQARDDALTVAEAQRARHHDAVAAHDAALEVVERLSTELAAAATELTGAQGRLVAATDTLRSLGWRAGVPGPNGLAWPIDGRPGSGFGPRVHPIHEDVRLHQGVDVAAPTGQAVVAAAAGRVAAAGSRDGYGITVVVDHGGGRTTLYAHLSAVTVRTGQWVGQAALIGRAGSTGHSTGPHLHFEVREHGRARDPLPYFRWPACC